MAKDRRRQQSAPQTPKPIPNDVCYCHGARDVSDLELHCALCYKWFHGRCLKELVDLKVGTVNFMVCYVFHCRDCSPIKKETWAVKQISFAHMCVTVMSNLTWNVVSKTGETGEEILLSLDKDILPYFDEHWHKLTAVQKRKTAWHAQVQKALVNTPDIFKQTVKPEGEFFSLSIPLQEIGPHNELIKMIGRGRPASTQKSSQKGGSGNLTVASPSARSASSPTPSDVDGSTQAGGDQSTATGTSATGPKTRGASKRYRQADNGGPPSKKGKGGQEIASSKIIGEIPFNRDGSRFYAVEPDPNVTLNSEDRMDPDDATRQIPSQMYRTHIPPDVRLSSNDRAPQLRLSADQLTVSGHEEYCVIRATHSVLRGTWYYETTVTSLTESAAIRLGWSQSRSPLQACVGYTDFSYAIRSRHGTAFHKCIGKTYAKPGFGEGDVIGCLIHLPDPLESKSRPFPPSTEYLPHSCKEFSLINYKQNYYFEEREEDIQSALKTLHTVPGSYIEFFINGRPCGKAFTDLNGGAYFPAVSIFRVGTVQCNFGPSFRYPPPRELRARPMSERPSDQLVEQSVSDMLYLVENNFV